MALYHIGAFGGSLHGSTKTTTFRRSKSGIVSYDRPDPHTTRRAAGDGKATRNKVAMQLAGQSSQYLLPYMNLGGVETKYGSVYNKLMRICYEQMITPDFATNTRSLLYDANTIAETGEKIAECIAAGAGAEFSTAWNYFLSGQWNPSIIEASGWSQYKCYVNAKFQGGVSGFLITKNNGNVTITALDGMVHNVEIKVLNLTTPQAISVTGQTGTAIDVSAAAPKDTNAASMYYEHSAALLSIKVDGKKITESFSDAFLCFKPA